MSEQSIEDVLADELHPWDCPARQVASDQVDALASADLPLVDRDRGIAVIRLDPELAGDLRWGADHLAPSEITMTPPPRGSLRWAAAVMDAAARIIGGEQSDGD